MWHEVHSFLRSVVYFDFPRTYLNMGLDDLYTVFRGVLGHYWENYITERGAAPEYQKGPSFDPTFGFDAPRKERVMIATQDEMEAACVPIGQRDYCAHIYIDLKKCMTRNYPIYWKCKHLTHEYHHCEHEDTIMRFKEYERERRLKKRELTLAGKDMNGNPIKTAG